MLVNGAIGNPGCLQIECFQEKIFCKQLQNRRNLLLRREYALARIALGGAPLAVIQARRASIAAILSLPQQKQF